MKIIDDTPEQPQVEAAPKPKPTGIRPTLQGSWAAIKRGVLVADFSGPGSKAKAIKAAGTNAVIA